MIDFWKDYDGQSETPPIRGYLVQHSTFFNNYSFEGLDFERIKAYCKAIGKEYEKQAINAKFMNEMEEWYLNLAEKYSALDKIKAEIEQRSLGIANDSVIQGMIYEREDILKIIDKYRK